MYKSMLQEYSTASGSAMAENEVRMGSWETKINQLRNSINNFWNNTIDTSLVKSMISGITLLINNFGNLRTILGIIFTILAVNKGTAFLTFLKNFSVSTMLLNSSLVQTQARLAGMSFAQIGMMSTTTSLTFAIKGLWAAMLANPIGLVIGAVTAIIMVFDFMGASAEKSAQKQKEAFDELNRSINSLKQQTAEAKNLASQYELLSSITSRTADEETKLAEVKDRLIGQFPDLIQGYDSEGKAIIGSSEAIKQAIKDNEELLKVKQEQMSNTFITDGSNNFSQLQKDQERLGLLTKHKEEYLKTIDDINNGSQVQFDEYGNDSLAIAKNNLKGIKDELSTLSIKILESRKDLSVLTESFLKSGDSAQSLGKEIVTKLIYSLSSLKDEAKITGEQFTTIFEGLKTSNFASDLNKAKTTLEGLSKSGATKEEIGNAYEEAISGLTPYLKSLGDNGEEAGRILKDMLNLPNVQDASNKINNVTTSLKSLQETLSNSASAISEIQSELDNYNEAGSFSLDNIIKLSAKYPQLLGMLGDEKSIRQELTNIIQQEQKKSEQAYLQMIETDKTYYENKILLNESYKSSMESSIQSLVDSYGLNYNVDLDNFKSLAEAKMEVERQLLKTLSANWSQYYDIERNSLTTDYTELSRVDPEAAKKVHDAVVKASQLAKGFDGVVLKSSGIDFSQIGMSGSKDSSSKKDKEEKELSIESTTQALINQIQQEYILQKAKSDSIQKDLTQAQSQKDYAKTLKLTNSLIASQRTEMELLQSARSKINQLKDSAISAASPQFGNVSDRWFIGNDNQKSASFIEEHNRASEDTRKIMDETFDSLQLLRNAWMSNKSAMDENAESQNSLKQSLLDIQSSQADEAITALKSYYQNEKELAEEAYSDKVKLAEKAHQKVLDDLDEEEKAYEETVNAQIDAIDKLKSAEDYTKNLTTAQSEAQTIQDQISIYKNDTSYEGKEKLAELQAQLAEKNSSIEDIQNDHTIELRKQNLQDSLDTIKKELEAQKSAENTKYEATKERLDAEKVKLDEHYTAIMENEAIFAEIRQGIIDGNITKINEALSNFSKGFTIDLVAKAKEIDESFQAIIKTINQIKTASDSIPNYDVSQYASGTNGAIGGLSVVSEKGRELISPPNGKPFLSGNNGPELMILPKDTEVLPNNLTESLISKAKLLNIPSYANGTGINGSLMDLIKNMPSILPNISLQPFKMPQLANNLTNTTTNNLNPTFNISVPKGTTRDQAQEVVKLVYKDLVKMIKK